MAPTVTSLYSKHRRWALDLAREHDDSDEGRLTALVSLWRCVRAWDPDSSFKEFAEPQIVAALKRTAVEA
jgi:hypothetical protein